MGESKTEVKDIVISPGTVIRIVAQSGSDKSASTKKGKDTRRDIDKLLDQKNTLEVEVTQLLKEIDRVASEKSSKIKEKTEKLEEELALQKDSLSKLVENTKEELVKQKDAEIRYRMEESKLHSIMGVQKEEVTEYNAKCVKMRKEMNAHVLVAKNKVDNFTISYEKLQSGYNKMELDLKEGQKAEEKLRKTKEDLDAFDIKLNERAAALSMREVELRTKESWFNAGQKKYNAQYKEREEFYLQKVKEYNDNMTTLAKEQKSLAENWEVLKKEKAKIGSEERNRKRVR